MNKKVLSYWIIGLSLTFSYVFLRGIEWRGAATLHTVMEGISTTLALLVGVMALVRFYADKNNTITKDAYTRVDVGATYKIALQNTDINIRFNVQNLLDTDYLAGGGVSNVTAGDGVNFRLATQISF